MPPQKQGMLRPVLRPRPYGRRSHPTVGVPPFGPSVSDLYSAVDLLKCETAGQHVTIFTAIILLVGLYGRCLQSYVSSEIYELLTFGGQKLLPPAQKLLKIYRTPT